MSKIWTKKPLSMLLEGAHLEERGGLKRTLGPVDLIALGVGAIIGAGLFVRTANAAGYHAGPAVTIGFIIAGIGCAFAGLCYAEFASMIPIAGSAYTYSYATMGELMAWIIGWDLVLEYAVGAATVGIAWSQDLNKLLQFIGTSIPYEWCHSPLETLEDKDTKAVVARGIMNVPALGIILLLSLVLIRGIKESAVLNGIIVLTKVTIVILFIALGWAYMNPANHTPYWPEASKYVEVVDGKAHEYNYGGILGVLAAAGIVFFAFIGFDAVSTAAQEAKNPKRDMPIGILGSLVVCTVLYVLFSHVLTGMASVADFRSPAGREASVAYAIQTHMPQQYGWLAKFVTVAILAGFSSVILVMLLGQSRVFYSMSRDGLVPKVFSDLHPRFKTPWKSNLIFFLVCGGFAAFLPEKIVGDMTSIGTLFAFVLVCAGVLVMRKAQPDAPRQFRTPFVPVVPILGIITCGAMMYGLDLGTWYRLIGWMALGLVIYFGYSIKRSHLNNATSP